jgi:hypothetical protein
MRSPGARNVNDARRHTPHNCGEKSRKQRLHVKIAPRLAEDQKRRPPAAPATARVAASTAIAMIRCFTAPTLPFPRRRERMERAGAANMIQMD